jgi:uncharacterized protein (DUF983 family)
MLKKGSKLNSILTGTCPKCQKESMYLDPNPLHLSKILKMHNNCSHCGFNTRLNLLFYAMYVSYGLNVAIGIATFIISHIIFNSNEGCLHRDNSCPCRLISICNTMGE